MLRIDEIYQNVFWQYLNKHCPDTRLFYCDPFGCTDPENLKNFAESDHHVNYMYVHDQEPIYLDIHTPLFDSLISRNSSLRQANNCKQIIVTSEYNSEAVQAVSDLYGLKSFYYFFHGWAALDWFRGYDKTFLITPPAQRKITTTYLAPNRIIAGKRSHRLELLYLLFRQNLQFDNFVSCPLTCPSEQVDVNLALKPVLKLYPDAKNIFAKVDLPLNLPGEVGHPMHSCWLSGFDLAQQSLLYLVTETVAFGRRNHLTEKVFKPICLQMPFILASTKHSLKYLRNYGFQTFGNFWDESYDNEDDDHMRLKKIAKLVKDLNSLTTLEKQKLYEKTMPVVEHNYQHFYQGNFEKLLWQELCTLLENIKKFLK